jgi:hypothetical protein
VWNRQYGSDVLADGQSGRSGRRRVQRGVPTVEAERGLVVEDSEGRFCGAVVGSREGGPGDLEPELLGRVEELIDFVTAPGND